MYDRAPRRTAYYLVGSTKANVGPGTYEPRITDRKWLKADGYAPFLSTATRETFFHVDDAVVAAPGPAAYVPKEAQYSIQGGRPLTNQERRFRNVDAERRKTPGPGTYNLSKKRDWIKSAPTTALSKVFEQPQTQHKAIVTSRVRYLCQAVAPSIPSPGQAFGYEEADDGILQKQTPVLRDSTLGPAYYQPSHSDTAAADKYRGVHFGALKSTRCKFAGKPGPGPGEYDPSDRDQVPIGHVDANSKKFESRLPRYHEIVVLDERRKACPGPGKYEISGMFTKKPVAMNTEGLEVEHPPFMSQAKRFERDSKVSPAPGSYNDPRHALEALKKVTGMKRAPFGQTAVRFHSQNNVTPTPGPGRYNIFNRGVAKESLRKAIRENTRKGVFGTTSLRVAPALKQHQISAPGPSRYQPLDRPEARYKKLNAMSAFASHTHRLRSPVARTLKENPPPGSYEVAHSFEKSQDKRSSMRPRTKEACRRNRAFLSSSNRFAQPRDVVIDKPEPIVPGPGTYNEEKRKNKVALALMVTKTKRFDQTKKDFVPGPGAYELSPLMASTVLQGTFNTTLNNPVIPVLAVDNKRSSTSKKTFMLGI